MAKKVGLALGSGGARGIAHVGVIKALKDNGVKISMAAGCSAGSVIGAGLAKGFSPQKMLDILCGLTGKDLVDPSVNFLGNKALLKGQKLRFQLEKYFGEVDIKDLKMPFATIATDISAGKLYEFFEGDLVTAVTASSSIPVIFPPVEYSGLTLVDGGVINRTPVDTVKKLGADVVVAVDVCDKIEKRVQIGSLLSVVLRTVDVMDNAKPRQRKKDCIFIRPDLSDIDPYKVERQKEIFERGYKAALSAMKKIKALVCS